MKVVVSLVFCSRPPRFMPADHPLAPPIRRHVDAFIAMLGGTDGFEAFIDGHMSAEFVRKGSRERGAFIFRVLAKRYGGRPARLESLSATAEGASIKLSNSAGEWAEYELLAEPGDPEEQLGGFNARILPTPLANDFAGLTEAEVIAELDRFVKAEAAAGRFSGSVILARDGKELYGNAVDLADRAAKVANRPDTRFLLASVTKLFTATAIGQLAERGRLSYDDPVGKHLPKFPNARLRDSVTVGQLLNHTSGLDPATLIGPDEPEHGQGSAGLWEQAIAHASRPPMASPGRRYVYSNAGPVVLALIVEALTGKSFAAALEEQVLKPAGMAGAGFDPLQGTAPRATGHALGSDGVWRSTGDMLPPPGDPSGGLWASARDLLEFSRALTADRLMGKGERDRMMRGGVDVGENEKAGYGWMDKQVNGMRFVGHVGSLPGWSSDFCMIPDRGYSLIVLCNNGPSARAVADRVRQMLSLARKGAGKLPDGGGQR